MKYIISLGITLIPLFPWISFQLQLSLGTCTELVAGLHPCGDHNTRLLQSWCNICISPTYILCVFQITAR
jgi:hypothetical protein